MELHICKDYNELSEHIADWMVEYICKTLSTKQRFSIALTGGSTPKKLYEILASDEYKNKIDWSRANVFVGDERFVPFNDERNNAKMISETLLNKVAVDPFHVHFMQTEGMSAETSANAYDEVLQHYFKKGYDEPSFDLVLLGMGDDAHTLSLFPGKSEAINEQTKWCTYLWLEQQDMYRITLTSPIVNAARCVAFLISGSGKANAFSNILHKKYDPLLYPSQIIRPPKGQLHWFVDEDVMNG